MAPVNFMPGDPTALVKAKISAIDGPKTVIDAWFNPKELTFDKQVPWQKHKNTEGDKPQLEFSASEPMMFNCELMFDLFEKKGDVYGTYIKQLQTLVLVDNSLGRPPMCLFTWGSALPSFQGVVEDLNVKYTLFLPDGTPTRATVQLKMKQADSAKTKAQADAEAKKASQTPGAPATAGQNGGTSGAANSSQMRNQAAGSTPPNENPSQPNPGANQPKCGC
jgi:hypothetical protein